VDVVQHELWFCSLMMLYIHNGVDLACCKSYIELIAMLLQIEADK